MKALDEKGMTHLDIAINLSFKQLQDKMFCRHRDPDYPAERY